MNRRAMVRIPLVLAAFVLLSGQETLGGGDAYLGCVALAVYTPYAAVKCATDECPWDEGEAARREARETVEERIRLANAGDARAQFEMYDTAGDDRYLWLCRSASSGYNPAQIALIRIYLGEGVLLRTPDYLHAYMWLRLLERSAPSTTGHGYETDDEQSVRNYQTESANWLTQDEMATAEALLRDWQPDPAACAARVVEQLGH